LLPSPVYVTKDKAMLILYGLNKGGKRNPSIEGL